LCGAVLLTACSDDGSSAGSSTGAPANGGIGATTGTSTSAPDLSAFQPSENNQDPSRKIPGVELHQYKFGQHVQAPQRVAYDQSPPFGGAHDFVWAACNGVVYKTAVRNENMVHTLEHGAVWIAYNPDKVTGDALAKLAAKVDGTTYLSLSPYPGLDHPVSVQAWGHRLKVDDPADPRIDEFITALQVNRYTTPEPGASCDQMPDSFDPDKPPPFDPSPPGADAMPVNGPTGSAGPAGSPSSTR
jgi:hypothetical protein